jgi:uncharacterized protein YndB with AHSA1/START domain
MTAQQTAVRVERNIPAAPNRVYRAWLDPETIRQWMAPGGMTVERVEVDERGGGAYRIWQQDESGSQGGFECELLELVPDERLVFRWGFVGPERTEGPAFDSRLTITLAEAPGGGTALTLVHERLEDLAAAMPEVAAHVGVGWESTLDKLAASVA